MIDREETENERQSKTLCYFFRHKLFKYLFMVVDDQRILEYLIVNVQVQLEQKGKKILKFPLSENDHYIYIQVKNYLESLGDSACDGLIVTGLNALIYRHGAKAIQLFNTSRDAFSRFHLPIAFVVNLEILKRIMRGAPDLYNMRDIPDLQFEGKWEPDMDILIASSRDYSPNELTNIDLKIQLLEEQLKRTEAQRAIDDDALNNMVIPLLILNLEQGNLKKMKSLYQQYIKENEHRVKDRDVLERYQKITAKPVISNEVNNKYIGDKIESRLHFIQEGEWDKAAEVTFELEEYLTLHGFPQRSMELLQELDDTKLTEKNCAIVYHLKGNLFLGFGDYDAALTQYQHSLEIKEKIGDIKGKSSSLHNIGVIYQKKGDYDAALTQYQMSLEIAEKIGDIKGAATTLHQISMIYQYKGDYDAALMQYQKSLEIFEKIGDMQGVSYSMHQIGRIYQEKGNYDAALVQYQKAKEILEKIGDIKNMSHSFGQIGIIYQLKGDVEAALTQYQKSLEISEKIGDIKGESDSLHQIGMIYQNKGDYEAALTQYQKSLEIREKIGDIAGMASSMSQMGLLYFTQNQFKTAMKLLCRAFLIFSKIGSPNAKKASDLISECRKKLPEERFQAILKEFEIDPKVFDPEDDETYRKMAMQFFSGITAQAVATSKPETSAEEIEQTRAQLIQWIDDVKDDPHQQPVKHYFQMLLAYVNKEDYQTLLQNIDPELKDIFENRLNHDQ